MDECMCMNYFLCKQKQRKLHPHLSVWEIQIWKCYHFSLSTIDNFELKDYFVTIICQIVSWYCSFKRPEFKILINIMDRVFKKKYLSDLKVARKVEKLNFFSLAAIYTPSPVFKYTLHYYIQHWLSYYGWCTCLSFPIVHVVSYKANIFKHFFLWLKKLSQYFHIVHYKLLAESVKKIQI
jgi:hypothetical protein